MRILHISTRLILGGSQENTVLSCEGQARDGHEVHLAYGPIYGPEGSMLARIEAFNRGETAGNGAKPRIQMHVVPHMVRDIRPWSDALARRELRALLRDVQPDIVHTHSSKAGILGREAAWACRDDSGRRPGVVHTVHGPPFHRHQSALKNRVYIALERWAAKRCHEIVCVCDAMTEQYLHAGIGRREQYSTVYSGMETARYLNAQDDETRARVRERLGLRAEDFVVGTVARLAELKGHDDLLEALAPVMEQDPALRMLWVGDGWWRERLLSRAQEMGVRDRIITTGLVESERVPGMIRAMDVLAHPSYREGLPRTVPQALLCRVPVVASDTDGTPEVCRDGETGRLIPTGDVEALREAIVWMRNHPRERAEMAERGRSWCAERFSARHMVDRLEEVYARALRAAGR